MLKVTLLVLLTIVTFDVTNASAFDRRDHEKRRHERAGKDTTAVTILTEGMITAQAREITDTTIIAEDINNKLKNLLHGGFFCFHRNLKPL